MSRTVRVYDPSRNPPEWAQLLRTNEVAVFLEYADRELPVTDSTHQATCDILSDLQAAELHCQEIIANRPDIRCLVFDSRGRAADPLATYESPSLRTHEITGGFRRWFSVALVTAAVLLIWIDWRSEFDRMWPSVLAWKFVTTALVFITWEAVLIIERRLARRNAS